MWRVISQVLLSVFVLQTWLYVAPTEGKKVVCYYANWAQYRPSPGTHVVSNIDPYLCTHFIFAFAQLNGTSVVPYEANDDQNQRMWRQFTNLKSSPAKPKTLLALGGYSHGTKRFSDLAANPASRTEFIKSVIIMLRYNAFDGLDLDWEYPGDDSPADKGNLNLLVKELREAFDRDAINNNNQRLLLAAAVPAGILRIEKGYDVAYLDIYLDFFNIMAYDYHGQWENKTNPASPLRAADNDPLNVVSTLQYYLAMGASKSKLNIGIGLYARTWTLSRSGDSEVGSAAIAGGTAGMYTREPGVLSYYEVCNLIRNGYTTRLDPVGQVMYAFQGNQWVTYENRDTINTKIDWILENDFGGAMVWSLDHDDFSGQFCQMGSYPLITLISTRMVNAPDSAQSTSTASSTTETTVSTSTASTTTASTTLSTAPVTAPSTLPNSGFKFVCPEESGKYPDSRDCRNYYVCIRKHALLFKCTSPQMYSHSNKMCVLPTQGACPV